MNIIRNLDEIKGPFVRPVLTIGNFDGVHRGHHVLFNKVLERAGALGGQGIVMTFDPHPIKVMKPGNGPPLITPTEQKLELISREPVDYIICLPFTREFAAISAEAFVRDILVRKIGVREVVVGYDYSFGAGREGDISLLRYLGDKLGFLVHVIEPVYIDGMLVSSTSIRKFIREGNLEDARRLLGRHYQICGRVVPGQGRGAALLGFPTANLVPVDELVPKEGVYAVSVDLGGAVFQGVTNIGCNPTFGDAPLTIETHLMDFSGDILGRNIRITFLRRLRDEMAFDGVNALSSQIARDIQEARELFSTLEGGAAA
ncbi:MAG: bifunctional riboflavin kinase/FAD synthetase [Desulfobacteraceae bacterium]